MTIYGTTNRGFHKRYAFEVEINGVAVAAFTTAGPLEVEVGDIEHFEGGALIPDKQPGLVRVTDLVLTRGATADVDLWNWFRGAVDRSAMPANEDDLKRTIAIVKRNRRGDEVGRWVLFNAYPKKYKGGEWDNTAEEVLIEEVTLRYDFPDQVAA